MKTLLPVMFVGHGSPTMALQPGAAGFAMTQAAAEMATPRAVVVISPHWETQHVTVGTASKLDTIHDFGGFDPKLYEIQYPAVGCPELAQRVAHVLQAAGLTVRTDPERGLDHGAWIPLRQMYPDAHVPVVPVSVQTHLGPAHAYRVGQALAGLAREGYLILGSGNVTHNLHDWQRMMMTGSPAPAYVQGFANWVHDQVMAADAAALVNYRHTRPDAHQAHPRDEHFLPLLTAMGAAGEGVQAEAYFRGISNGVIAMDSFRFWTESATEGAAA